MSLITSNTLSPSNLPVSRRLTLARITGQALVDLMRANIPGLQIPEDAEFVRFTVINQPYSDVLAVVMESLEFDAVPEGCTITELRA